MVNMNTQPDMFTPVRPKSELTVEQKKYVVLQAYHLWNQEEPMKASTILSGWPTYDVLDDDKFAQRERVGPRPKLHDIQAYMETVDFEVGIRKFGVRPNGQEALTGDQIAALTILFDIADGRSLKRKLNDVGVTTTQWRSWLKQPEFQRAYRKAGGDALKDSMPIAEQQIAAKIGQGDLAAIKFGMEVTGRYNPALNRAVDAEQLLGVVLEVLEETIHDPQLLAEIASKLSLKRQIIMRGGPSIEGEIIGNFDTQSGSNQTRTLGEL